MVRDLDIPIQEVREICRRYGVAELSLFGSALRNDFRPDSDIDLLVFFEPGARIGLLEFSALQHKLADLFGRDIDLVSKRGLKPVIRQQVLDSAQVIYAI